MDENVREIEGERYDFLSERGQLFLSDVCYFVDWGWTVNQIAVRLESTPSRVEQAIEWRNKHGNI